VIEEINVSQKPTKMVSLSELRTEAGSEELVRSERMKPYLKLLKAELCGQDTSEPLAALAALSLEDRYVWRVISALKWGLCDLETENVAAVLATLPAEAIKSVTEPLALRAMQFSLFLKAVVGETAAREIMLRALACQSE